MAALEVEVQSTAARTEPLENDKNDVHVRGKRDFRAVPGSEGM